MLLPFLLFNLNAAIVQITIYGTVKDSANSKPLPYVNIGINHKNIGCISLKDGSFSITIPAEDKTDTLTFSMVGYNDRKLLIDKISPMLILNSPQGSHN